MYSIFLSFLLQAKMSFNLLSFVFFTGMINSCPPEDVTNISGQIFGTVPLHA